MQPNDMRSRIVAHVRDFRLTHAYGPTVRELVAMTGRAQSVVQHHIDNLVADGVLLREAGRSRTLRINPQPRPSVEAIAADAISTQLTRAGEKAIADVIAAELEMLSERLRRVGPSLRVAVQLLEDRVAELRAVQ